MTHDEVFRAAAQVDVQGAREDLSFMQRSVSIVTTLGMVLAMTCAGAGAAHAQEADSKPMVYWCPDRPADQQYVARPGPGCTPIVKKRPAGEEEDENSE